MRTRRLILSVTGVVTASMLSVGCATKIHQHNLNCPTRSRAEIVRSSTALLVKNGFTITMSDTLIGIVQAETEETRSVWSAVNTKKVWQIITEQPVSTNKQEQANNKSVSTGSSSSYSATGDAAAPGLVIIATAKTVDRTQSVFGAQTSASETYYDDDSHSDWEWYWDVRKGLEALCGSKIYITTVKRH